MSTFPDFLCVIRLETCPSTNDFVSQNRGELKSRLPLLVLAREQTAGRGRGKNRWFSGSGQGIYATFAFSWSKREGLNLVSLVAGIAVAEMLKKYGRCPIALKWPNDVYCRGGKIGGVLIETRWQGESIFVVAGVGVNIRQDRKDFPEGLERSATSLKIVSGRDLDPEELSPFLADRFFYWLKILENGQTARIIKTFNRLSRNWLGKEIGFHSNRQLIRGIFSGVQQDGGMVLTLADGSRQVYYSGEIRDDPDGGGSE